MKIYTRNEEAFYLTRKHLFQQGHKDVRDASSRSILRSELKRIFKSTSSSGFVNTTHIISYSNLPLHWFYDFETKKKRQVGLWIGCKYFSGKNFIALKRWATR